ncbi:Ensconsin Epithelial microtubule-associated protein of 115 kDa [Collichthys lucidus]|uniref:Ensconsin Epithelial microtubule-associated protein of 115 kDa n=1 Tax=Collichthys lucidus TaxID=240159 RepID=A0A4U5VJR6_COLLU|nr:Ensconsin Epithelial microtubule-associated protein of 115 kDa [Collichthys lucidus]
MTEVASSCSEMTALAPPPTPLVVTSRNASPSRTSSNHRSPTGSLKHLAKEQWEDREKTQGLSDSPAGGAPCEMSEILRDKERRAQQQLDRCAEERGRKMEEQRRKEQRRKAAAEEKRRQQKEAEKVRGHSSHSG